MGFFFLKEAVQLAEIPDNLVSPIMDCIHSVSMRVLYNDEATDSSIKMRGIKETLYPHLYSCSALYSFSDDQ